MSVRVQHARLPPPYFLPNLRMQVRTDHLALTLTGVILLYEGRAAAVLCWTCVLMLPSCRTDGCTIAAIIPAVATVTMVVSVMVVVVVPVVLPLAAVAVALELAAVMTTTLVIVAVATATRGVVVIVITGPVVLVRVDVAIPVITIVTAIVIVIVIVVVLVLVFIVVVVGLDLQELGCQPVCDARKTFPSLSCPRACRRLLQVWRLGWGGWSLKVADACTLASVAGRDPRACGRSVWLRRPSRCRRFAFSPRPAQEWQRQARAGRCIQNFAACEARGLLQSLDMDTGAQPLRWPAGWWAKRRRSRRHTFRHQSRHPCLHQLSHRSWSQGFGALSRQQPAGSRGVDVHF
mmetsp:Transcript_63677/g.148469  ORF Transcript_63677/g.148469 Transcript_63677/m.148469 type:complete len:348 (+) Transcript_63677:316-1359(+)